MQCARPRALADGPPLPDLEMHFQWRDFPCFHAGRPACETCLIPGGGELVFREKQNSDEDVAFLAFLRVLRSKTGNKNQPGAAPEHLKLAKPGF